MALPLGYSFVRDLAITPFYSAKVVQVTGTNTFVIALKGTSNAYDLFQDGDIAKGVRPDVAVAAYAAITQFIQDNPNTNIILDGHSLGAFVSTDVAARITDEPPADLGTGSISAIGFNTPTISNSAGEYQQAPGSYNNIVSVNLSSDAVSAMTSLRGGKASERSLFFPTRQ